MSSYLVSVLTVAAVYAIATVSISLVVNFAGRITIAHGVIMGVGAYTYAVATMRDVPPLLAFVLAPLIAGLLGALLMMLLGRMEQHVFLLGTLALQYVGFEVIRRWDSVTNGNAGIPGIPYLPGIEGERLLLLAAVLTLVITLGVARRLRGLWGLRLRAIRDDVQATGAFGRSVTKELVITFAISCAIAGVAGAILAIHDSFIVPSTFGLQISLVVIVMAMVGGANPWASAVAAAGLIALPEIIYAVFDVGPSVQGPLQEIAYGVVLLAVMLLRPTGLGPELRVRKASKSELESAPTASRSLERISS